MPEFYTDTEGTAFWPKPPVRYLVTYQDSTGETWQATVRIADTETDLAGDARRQLVGNHLSVSEILLVEEDR